MAQVVVERSALTIRDFRPLKKGDSLKGFVEVRMASGLILSDVSIHRRGSTSWVAPPGKPQLDRNGVQMKDAAGRGLWTAVVSFSSKERRDRFSALVIAALLEAQPNALD